MADTTLHRILSHLLQPMKGGAPSLIVIFAVLLALSEQAGLAGLPLMLILTSWYSKYAFILFDSIVRGEAEPPALDIQMVNPFDEQRPLAQLCIFGVMFAIWHWIRSAWGPVPGSLAAAGFILVSPASVAVLGLEGNPLRALSPPVLVHIIRSLGRIYALMMVSAAVCLLLVAGVFSTDMWRPIQLMLALYLGLSLFGLLAGVLYDARDELGLEVWHSPEKTQARLDREDRRESQKTVDSAYGLIRAGRPVEGWAVLMAWLGARGHAGRDFEWLIEAVRSWPDDRFQVRLTQEYIDTLLAADRNLEALRTAETAVRRDPRFRPTTGASTLRLARIAASGGVPALARKLLEDFDTHFPGDLESKAAAALSQRLSS